MYFPDRGAYAPYATASRAAAATAAGRQATVLLRQRLLECRRRRRSWVCHCWRELDSVVIVCCGSMSGRESNSRPLARVSNSVGPARPLGYLMVTPTGGEPAGRSVLGPPPEGFPSGEGEAGTDTGSVGSVAMDPGSPAAATLDLTGVVAEDSETE